MKILKDIFDLQLHPNGQDYSEVAKDSSIPYLDKLLEHKLIRIDQSKKVFLTDRGRVAKKMGIEKYLDLEKFEKELKNDQVEERVLTDLILRVILGILLFVTALALVYVSWIVDFQ